MGESLGERAGRSSAEVDAVEGKIRGTVVSINQAGDLVTDICAEMLQGAPTDERVTIRCDGHMTCGLFSPDHNEPETTFLAMIDHDRQLTLILVGDSASAFLGIRVGAPVVVKW